MFRHSRCPFSLTDLDMWDTQSRFTPQASWCGMATLSGAGLLSRLNTRCGNDGGLRQNDPGLRRWQSLSHLGPEAATRPFPSSLVDELQATHGECSFRQSEMMQWLEDAHERLDSRLERLRSRDAQLSYHLTTAQLSDMKQKQFSEVMRTLKQEKEAPNAFDFEKNQQRRQIHEKIQTFEKDRLQMRTTLKGGSKDERPERSSGSCNRSLSGKQKVDTEQCELREAETTEKIQQVEQNQVLWQLQSSAETQKMLLNQIEELNQRLSNTRQNHSEMQEQLTEANNKISQTCLEKAILSTQVLKLEDNIKDLKAKLTEALSKKDKLKQEKADQVMGLQLDRTQPGSEAAELHDNVEPHDNKQDEETVRMKEESKALKEANEKLECELEMTKQSLKMLQCELQEETAERISRSNNITDLEADMSQLMREKEELLNKMNRDECEMKEKWRQLSESLEVLQFEKQKLQDQCRCLEVKLFEKEKTFLLQEEGHRKQDAVRVKTMEELKATVSHWTQKWQKVVLTLQSTQEELKDLKKHNFKNKLQVEAGHLESEIETLKEKSQKDKEQIDNLLQQNASMEKQLTDNKKESESLLRVELDACKQELELERSRSQMLLHRREDKGSKAAQSRDKGTVTDLSNFSVLWVPPAEVHSSQHKSPQVFMENSEDQWLKKALAEREHELQEKAEALKTLEKLRETEKSEAQTKISTLELKATEDNQDGEGQANVAIIDSLRAQLEESRRRVKQLQQEKMLPVQRLQTLKPPYPIKDENTSAKNRKDKTVYLETDQQRRMITEQLKNLFKEREEKEKRKLDETAAAVAQNEAYSPQDWIPTPTPTAVDRWNWQPSSGLTPVFEEDEEDIELQEKGELEEEARAQESIHNQREQMSAISAGHISVKAQHENRLQALRSKQQLQAQDETTTDAEVTNPCDLQQKHYFLYPDGIFLAEPVNICSPDEDEEEEEDKLCVS